MATATMTYETWIRRSDPAPPNNTMDSNTTDTEAAAVWERLSAAHQLAIVWLARDGSCPSEYRHWLARHGLAFVVGGGIGHAQHEPTDLGRRVVAHGRKAR